MNLEDTGSTSLEVLDEQNADLGTPQEEDPNKKVHDDFRTRIEACKNYRKKLIPTWVANIDYRRGKPFTSQTDEDRVAVNMDWSLTKTKHADLFSQIPQVRINHSPQSVQAGPWLHAFEQKINDSLISSGIEAAMDECLPDVINAAGIAGVIILHESLTEDKEVPSIDFATLPPEIAAQVQSSGMMPDGSPVPTEVVPQILDHRYAITRLSPSDLLWPISFTGSDFDNAPWVGRSGRLSWAQAIQCFGKTDQRPNGLVESDKEKLGEERTSLDRLTHDVDKDKIAADDEVGFDEVFYKEFHFNPEAKSFSTIHHLVFINGKEIPIIDEPWKGQEADKEDGLLIGSMKYPIRLLTLNYISDEAIPPSDTAIGRAQVNELAKGRSQMILQRERSLPVRWVNINGVDPTVTQSLMRGTWNGMIPVQSDGTRLIGEVARATMPQENFLFDRIIKADLNELWNLGPNQQGEGTGIETAAEANAVQLNYQTRLGRERAKVAKFFVSIAEVLGGLVSLYEQPEEFGEGFNKTITRTLNYSILADSTVLVDAKQRMKQIVDFVNFTAKSGFLNLEPILKELATLSGFDANLVIQPPPPKPPAEPNISLRLTGVEDLSSPMSLAMLIKSGQAPSPEEISKAKQLIAQASMPPPNAPPTYPGLNPGLMGATDPNFKDGDGGTDGDGNPLPAEHPPEIVAGPLHGKVPVDPGSIPQPAPPQPGQAHPEWALMDRINKREEEGQGGG